MILSIGCDGTYDLLLIDAWDEGDGMKVRGCSWLHGSVASVLIVSASIAGFEESSWGCRIMSPPTPGN